MRNAGLEEAQAGIKIAGRNINSLRYVDDTTLMAGHSENEDHGIWSHHFMGNRWGNTERWGSSVRLSCSKITAEGDYSHEIKRHLLLGRKVMANLYSILKSRDITLPTKVHPVKAMVFPVVMYGCESWTIKKS